MVVRDVRKVVDGGRRQEGIHGERADGRVAPPVHEDAVGVGEGGVERLVRVRAQERQVHHLKVVVKDAVVVARGAGLVLASGAVGESGRQAAHQAVTKVCQRGGPQAVRHDPPVTLHGTVPVPPRMRRHGLKRVARHAFHEHRVGVQPPVVAVRRQRGVRRNRARKKVAHVAVANGEVANHARRRRQRRRRHIALKVHGGKDQPRVAAAPQLRLVRLRQLESQPRRRVLARHAHPALGCCIWQQRRVEHNYRVLGGAHQAQKIGVQRVQAAAQVCAP